MCVRKALEWIGLVPKAPKAPQAARTPTAPPVQRIAQAQAAEGTTERLKDEEDAGKEKVQTTKDPNAIDTRNALKSLGSRKKPVADTQLPTTTPGGVVT